MRIRIIFSILSVLFIFIIPVLAQGLLGKSQLLIAYESKNAFLGEVLYIGDQSEGLYTGIGTAQTVIFKVKKQLKGEIRDKFVKISFETTERKNLKGLIFEKSDYIVFLNKNNTNGESGFCGNFELDSKTLKFKVSKNPKQSLKMPCYFADLKSTVEGTKEELQAVTSYLTFLNRKENSMTDIP